ncbi:hypothetical protein CHARACLAT_021170 [Characodon lateralis]|uniref:Uncharacterized protein n=1 Tax=Characodon lateralis TaxID=208331 RepID=A0ABU7CT21_9TELE|nr:hypothetical protein [Characodon lateralis]
MEAQMHFAQNTLRHHGKIKRYQRVLDLQKSGSSMGTISGCVKVPPLCYIKKQGNVQPSSPSIRRQVLCPRDVVFWCKMYTRIPEQNQVAASHGVGAFLQERLVYLKQFIALIEKARHKNTEATS